MSVLEQISISSAECYYVKIHKTKCEEKVFFTTADVSAGLVKVLDESSSSIWMKSEDVEVGPRAASTEASSESRGDLGDSINPRQIR